MPSGQRPLWSHGKATIDEKQSGLSLETARRAKTHKAVYKEYNAYKAGNLGGAVIYIIG